MSFNKLSKKTRGAILALAAATMTGCASMERTSPGMMDGLDVVGGETPAVEAVVVRNSGFDLFYLFTIFSGDVAYSQEKHSIDGGLTAFHDNCNCSDCYRTMQEAANEEGKNLTNVSMFNNSLPSGGFTGYVQLMGFIMEFEDVGCSGVMRAKKKKLFGNK